MVPLLYPSAAAVVGAHSARSSSIRQHHSATIAIESQHRELRWDQQQAGAARNRRHSLGFSDEAGSSGVWCSGVKGVVVDYVPICSCGAGVVDYVPIFNHQFFSIYHAAIPDWTKLV